MENKLYYGDNLEILRNDIADNSVDLIYLDPPFNSKADYNMLFKEENGTKSVAQVKAFSDFWHWDRKAQDTYDELINNPKYPEKLKKLIIAYDTFLGHNDLFAYLVMLTIRLVEMRRVLKDTGTLYLHCDPTASHYIKLVMDNVFGHSCYLNEIIWSYRTGGAGKRWFSRKHDIIFYYSKSNKYNFYPLKERVYYEKSFFTQNIDEKGRYYADVLLRDVFDGVINLVNEKQKKVECISVKPVINLSKERLGYPTQKPVGLLEVLIRAATNEGDLVLDPFCGCGTALDAAEKLHRRWIGMDITHVAVGVIKNRIIETYPDAKFGIIGEPTDLEGAKELANQDRFQFQAWALSLMGATPSDKMSGDHGIDGTLRNTYMGKNYYGIIQVKSGKVSPRDIRDLKGTINTQKADYGIFITLENPSKDMITEAVSSGNLKCDWGEEIPKVQILTIEELLNNKKPELPAPPNKYNTAKKGKRANKESIQKSIDDSI